MNPRLVRFEVIFSGTVWVLVAAAAIHFLTGCTSSPGVTLASMPAWIPPLDAKPIEVAKVAAEVGRLAPGAQFRYSDDRYSLVSRPWLASYLSWTWDAALRAHVVYTPESFDCEDFAVLFAVLANRAAAKAGVKAAPLIARVVVALPSGERHELIGVATDDGILIVEPQPAAGAFRTTPLAAYKNRILSVILGD